MTNQDDIIIKAEITELKAQFTDMLVRQSKTEAAVEQLNKSIAAGNRMTIWQFISFVVVMAGTLLGTMYWSTAVLERSVNSRIDLIEKNAKERHEEMNKRHEQTEKNVNARIEDLRQVVLSKR